MKHVTIPAWPLVFLLAACTGTPDGPSGTTPDPVPSGDWIALFDGTSMDAFRGYGQDALPEAWGIVDGAMTNSGDGRVGDIVTRSTFADFDLLFEWKVDEGGNSGVMFRVTEDHGYPWETGPEYQLLDNAGHTGASPKNMAGANYDVHATDPAAVRPAGTWNTGRILVDGNHVEHWLNGQQVVSYELFSPAWNAAVADSKWENTASYGREPFGHIAVQGDHDRVYLRNVRIRPL